LRGQVWRSAGKVTPFNASRLASSRDASTLASVEATIGTWHEGHIDLGNAQTELGWRRWRHRLLTIGLLTIVMLRSLVIVDVRTTLAVELLAAGLILGFVGISWGRRCVIVGGILLTFGLIFGAMFIFTWESTPRWVHVALVATGAVLTISFISFVCAVILRDVLSGPVITVDSVFGAVCVYLLSGIVWANLYLLVYLFNPDAFVGLHAGVVEPASPTAVYGCALALEYFSFATLTSLGYGDILPKSHVARTLAWMEAAAGHLYMAVMVARLVALETARLIEQRGKQRPPPDDPPAVA